MIYNKGYCYFNNAAVVARTALEKYGLKRILIVDWDVHHGQGVQYAFYNDPRWIIIYKIKKIFKLLPKIVLT